jgi:hypothetical protein
MQAGDVTSSNAEHPKHTKTLRNSNRALQIDTTSIASQNERKNSQGPTSAPSSPQTSGKRVFSFDQDVNGGDSEVTESQFDPDIPMSASSTGSGELSGHVCLCQPEPKIPRPRNGRSDFFLNPDVNVPERCGRFSKQRMCSLFADMNSSVVNSLLAFILYRQHHQHALITHNPGLANPEISKIIGEQWKAESETEKKIWQDLAQV